jgi:hypothetical protein
MEADDGVWLLMQFPTGKGRSDSQWEFNDNGIRRSVTLKKETEFPKKWVGTYRRVTPIQESDPSFKRYELVEAVVSKSGLPKLTPRTSKSSKTSEPPKKRTKTQVESHTRASPVVVKPPLEDPAHFVAQANVFVKEINEADDLTHARAYANLWNEHLMPVCRQFQFAHLDGSFMPKEESLKWYPSVLELLQRRMRRTPETSHLTLPMLHSIVCRMLGVPVSCIEMAIVACAVWGLDLCDRRDWFTASGAYAMKLHARFLGDGMELLCVPKHYLQKTSTVEFRNKLLLVGTVLAEDYNRRCIAKYNSCCSHGDEIEGFEEVNLAPIVVTGMDALLDTVLDYSIRCRKWHQCSRTKYEDKSLEAKDKAEKLFRRDQTALMTRASQTHLLGAFFGNSKFSIGGTTSVSPSTFSWMLVVANEIAMMESISMSTETIPVTCVDRWPLPKALSKAGKDAEGGVEQEDGGGGDYVEDAEDYERDGGDGGCRQFVDPQTVSIEEENFIWGVVPVPDC